MHPTRYAIAATLASTITAQTTWLVDDTPGPGVNFTSLPAAVAAAASGDTLRIRDGNYAGFLVSGKALALRQDGAGAVTIGAVEVTAVPTGAVFVLSNLRLQKLGQTGPLAALQVGDGTVVALDCDMSGVQGSGNGLRLESGAVVHAHRCAMSGGDTGASTGQLVAVGLPGAWIADGAKLVAVDCDLVGGDVPFSSSAFAAWGGSGITSEGIVELRDVDIIGGDASTTYGSAGAGGDGATCYSGTMLLAGDSSATGGLAAWTFGLHGPAVREAGGEVVVHAGVALVPNGASVTSGPVQLDPRFLPRLWIDGTARPNGELDAAQPATVSVSQGPANAVFFFAAGLAPTFTDLGALAAGGHLFVDLTGSGGAISTGFLDATGSFSVSLLPSTSLAPLLGLPIHAQAGAYDASSLQVLTSNPVVRIFSL